MEQTLKHGRAEVVHMRRLPQHDADVNARDNVNRTSLHFTSGAGIGKVTQLLEYRVNKNAQSMAHNTPLCLASGLRSWGYCLTMGWTYTSAESGIGHHIR